MTRPTDTPNLDRRQFLKRGSSLAAGAAVLGALSPRGFAAADDTIRLALIGCGGRGTGAVGDALNVPDGGAKLYAMADVVEERMNKAHEALKGRFGDQIDVPAERKFVGFKAYQQAIDILRPGDVAMCT
ncbi:MAG: twin-arginine translocation signal domain-containing protein, partial [Phycisphaerales bacterium]